MKLTDKEIIEALEQGKAIRPDDMPAHCFVKSNPNKKGTLEVIDWGQNMGTFNVNIYALQSDTWHVANEETE
jgi:hypothetical protein